MTEQDPNPVDVDARGEQTGGESMPERMRTQLLLSDTGSGEGEIETPLKRPSRDLADQVIGGKRIPRKNRVSDFFDAPCDGN